MRPAKSLLLALGVLAASAAISRADINVVASIKPVHSLVAAVMHGVGTPDLIVEGSGSPHTYALKPSQARMLEKADVVFWIGHEMEAFLEKPLETIAADAKPIELINAHDLVKLGFREGGAFEKHHHDDDGNHDHEAKAGHEEAAEAEDDHAHGAFDAHVWLDPVNAKAMVHEIEQALAEADPDNADKYEANAEAVMRELDALVAEITAELEPVKDRSFIVFHDAYRYFENRFDVKAAGSITVSPEVIPGAGRVSEIRAKVQELGAACVFTEPQFEPKLVSTAIEGTGAKSGVLDPLGTSLADGPELYFELIRNMASSIKSCLAETSQAEQQTE
jgi:zinc transport system substrate-binding protein